jgi:hypothetical protein
VTREDLWLKVFVHLDEMHSVTDLKCPCCEHSGHLDFQYVGDLKTRRGYLQIWCRNCNRGKSFSRLLVPQWAPILDWHGPRETIAQRIPAGISEDNETEHSGW